MSLRLPRGVQSTAAWRISVWTTLAFAIGSAFAFAIVYMLVARDADTRRDIWLEGEAGTLAEVAARLPRGASFARRMQEVAEFATRDVLQEHTSHLMPGEDAVFFLNAGAGCPTVWVGPSAQEPFLQAIEAARLSPDVPQTVRVSGWPLPFRVIRKMPEADCGFYLGYCDVSGTRTMQKLTARFLLVWCATVALGFLISLGGAYRALLRLERISNAVDNIDSNELKGRVPEGPYYDEIARLSHTFNRLLDRIEASNHELRLVTDSVAHDLKSPITSIRGNLEVALSDGENGKWRESVAEAIEGLDRLAQTLNTALDISEADAGVLRLRREAVELAPLVQQLVDLYQPSLAEHNHILECDLESNVVIEADRSLLNRMIANLLDNETVHLPRGCSVNVTVRAKDGMAELIIEDDGPGFPADLRPHVLERFVKGPHSNGHGLGLAFVNAVAQAHGGAVLVADRPGGGASIELALPLAKVLST
ncbi:MAG: HAMP domain-containing sensor histidine kinase [Candidatus Korobacteraceae bacterium]|jgi:signal transduction histidine kinase